MENGFDEVGAVARVGARSAERDFAYGEGSTPPRPTVTEAVTRGAARLFAEMDVAVLPEFRLPNGRRADIAGLDTRGRLIIAEVKSCEADFFADEKWPEYLLYCDDFYFAVDVAFPRVLAPAREGLIIADGFGGAIVREPATRALPAARRKALTLRFARQAAARFALTK